MSNSYVVSGDKPALFATPLLALLKAAGRQMVLRRARRQLSELPDHLLRDIGIHRSEIEDSIRYGRNRHQQQARSNGLR